MVFNEGSVLPPVSAPGCAGMVLTKMQLEQGRVIKDLRIKGVCTGQGHPHIGFGIAHLELCSEPGMGEHMEDVVSSSEINVPGFPEGTLTPAETADAFGCVKCLSDLGVFPFTGPELGNISKLLVALKCPHSF